MDHDLKPSVRGTKAAMVFFLLLTIAVWLGSIGYLISANKNQNLPINYTIFGVIFGSMVVCAVPTIVLRLKLLAPSNPKRIFYRIFLNMLALLWTFSPFYTILVLNEISRQGLLLLTGNYLWEVPVLVAIYSYIIYRRFSRAIKKPDATRKIKLLYLPIRATLEIFGVVAIAVVVGTVIAKTALLIPTVEMIKVILGIATTGLFAGIFIFFILQREFEPWLEP